MVSRSDEHEGGAEEKTDDKKVEKFPSTFLFAGSLIAIVPVVILFALIEKWLVGGLTAGSVK